MRQLPSVDVLLNHPAVAGLLVDQPRAEVRAALRELLAMRRSQLLAGEDCKLDTATLARELRERLYARAQPRLRRVLNATGIVLHTGLGRAPLAEEAIEALAEVAGGYCNLELDLETGQRGDRQGHLRALLCELTGAEDALVVNNNAAATWLALHALGAGGEALIARGQLVEIGGSYRLPDIMAAAGCRMVEVGTTNRTRISDYARALTPEARLLVRVHTSNYRMVGFTEDATLAELVALARQHGLVVIDDLGSGLLRRDLPWDEDEQKMQTPAGGRVSDLFTALSDPVAPPAARLKLPGDEPVVCESVAGGADLTLFSGDKLLGGPQAGILVGRRALLERLKQSPLTRALRPDKLTLAALEATLRLYRDPETAARRLPVYRFLLRPLPEITRLAEQLAETLVTAGLPAQVAAVPEMSEVGGGAVPEHALPTRCVAVRPHTTPCNVVAELLRQREVPVLCRVRAGVLLFDLRTIEVEELDVLAGAIAEALREADAAGD
ncbi:MAG: L-seryl-tRNA(Sec) selenium transferase [Phycisphaerales bacterium]|nr:L-seryl-tRNA(Sec) selenium transferase [Phycisphaerales bacterium]